MIARLLAVAMCCAVALGGVATPSADAAKKGKRVPVCKTKAASKKAAKQPRRKRRCRPQARHLKRPVAERPTAAVPAPAAETVPGAPAPVATPIADLPVTPREPAPAPDPTCGPSPNLGATAEDVGGFRLRLSRTCIDAGLVHVNYRNADSDEHDLWAMPVGGPGAVQQVIAETGTTEMPLYGDVTLTAGRWELFCSINGHSTMRAGITVRP